MAEKMYTRENLPESLVLGVRLPMIRRILLSYMGSSVESHPITIIIKENFSLIWMCKSLRELCIIILRN